MKWMDRVWALLVLAAAAVLGALLCGHIVDAKQAQTALLLVATTALLVLAGTLVWIGNKLQDILRRLKEQEYTSLLPNEEKTRRCRLSAAMGCGDEPSRYGQRE